MKNFRNESGAFDMPSIIIGVIVVGILTAGVLATIFGVVPWSQDKAAKQELAAVVTAQKNTQALTASNGPGVFMSKDGLIADGAIGAGDSYNTKTSRDGKCFTAAARSKSGKVFWADSDDTGAREYVSGDKSGCAKLKSLAWDVGNEMVTTWKVAANQTLTLPLGGAVNTTINWGDGTPIQSVTTASPSHTFISANPEQTITVVGTFASWSSIYGSATAKSLLSVDEWGETETTDLRNAFNDADNLRHVESIPETTKILDSAFINVGSDFTIGDLDTSNVTSMVSMFWYATAFNQPLNFDTSNVTNMKGMFQNATSFNQDLSKWNVAKVTSWVGFDNAMPKWPDAFKPKFT